jgi:hypothetical protein
MRDRNDSTSPREPPSPGVSLLQSRAILDIRASKFPDSASPTRNRMARNTSKAPQGIENTALMNRSGSWLLSALLAASSGCTLVPVTEWNAVQAKNRAMGEQNRAQLAEIDPLQAHCRTVEDRLLSDERQLAALKERARIERRQLEGFQRERDGLDEQSEDLASRRGRPQSGPSSPR